MHPWFTATLDCPHGISIQITSDKSCNFLRYPYASRPTNFRISCLHNISINCIHSRFILKFVFFVLLIVPVIVYHLCILDMPHVSEENVIGRSQRMLTSDLGKSDKQHKETLTFSSVGAWTLIWSNSTTSLLLNRQEKLLSLSVTDRRVSLILPLHRNQISCWSFSTVLSI